MCVLFPFYNYLINNFMMLKFLRTGLLAIACLFATSLSAQYNVLDSAGIDWQFDNGTGWGLIEGVPTANALPEDLTFETANDSTMLRITAKTGIAGNMTALVSSYMIDSIFPGDYEINLRFRNGMGGLEETAGALEIRFFIQDSATWTNFSPDVFASQQIVGIFKLGGISKSIWPDETSTSIEDSDDDDDFANSGEWVDVMYKFSLKDTLVDHSLKILFRIGSAHAATEDVNFEMDYIEWKKMMIPTSIATIVAENSVVLYPNPVVDQATLRFNLTKEAEVSLGIYSLSGQLLKTMTPQTYFSGTNEIQVNTSGLSQGIYLYKLTLNGETVTGKLSIVK